MYHRRHRLDGWPLSVSCSALQEEWGWVGGHDLFSYAILQGCAAPAVQADGYWAASHCQFQLLAYSTCGLLIIPTQVMHGLQGQYSRAAICHVYTAKSEYKVTNSVEREQAGSIDPFWEESVYYISYTQIKSTLADWWNRQHQQQV